MKTVRTQRLSLIPCSAEVARAALRGGGREVGRLLGVEVDPLWPPADLLEILPGHADVVEAAPSWATWGVWLVFDKEGKTLIGDAGFKGPPCTEGDVEIGYGIVEAHRGKGYATETVRALAEWAFGEPRVLRLLARCFEDNLASQGVLKKVGFRLVGTEDGVQEWEYPRQR